MSYFSNNNNDGVIVDTSKKSVTVNKQHNKDLVLTGPSIMRQFLQSSTETVAA